MEWLEQHRVVLNCFNKTCTCVNNDGEIVNVKGIPRKTTIRQISTLKFKRVVQKGCKTFAVTVINEENTNNEDKLKLEDISILREYSDVFSEEIPDYLRSESYTLLLSWYLLQCPYQKPLIG